METVAIGPDYLVTWGVDPNLIKVPSTSTSYPENEQLLCDTCGYKLRPEHAHFRCDNCGNRTSCCEGI